jgi:hypothetical protein
MVLLSVIVTLTPAGLRAAPPMLATSGNQIIIKDTGESVRLTGVNIPSLEWGNGEHLLTSLDKAVDTWCANVVRLPVKDSSWLTSSSYRTIVDNFIAQASSLGIYVILDLHSYAYPTATSAEFWADAAAHFANNPAVLYGLLNEPHGTTWDEWRNGYQGNPGMQDLVDTVRTTGARNVMLAGGLDYAYDLSGVYKGYALTDTSTGNGIIYDSHLYPWKGYWQDKAGNPAQHYPVLFGELGHPDGTTFIGLTFEAPDTWVPKVMDWVDKHNLNWTGWCFHPAAKPCMIIDWNYTPTSFWGAPALARLQGYRNSSVERILGGTVIGTPGTRLSPDSGVLTDSLGAVGVFEGAGSWRYFDAATSNNAWCGMDLVHPQMLTRIEYMPRSSYGSRMVGGVFEASNVPDFSRNVETLYTITTAPDQSGTVFTSATVSPSVKYRYIRYVGPPGAYCNVGELTFYGYGYVIGEETNSVPSGFSFQLF